MTFVNESCFATVPSCTVSGFLSGIHTVMTFALKKQKRLCRRTVLCGQQTGFISVEENSFSHDFRKRKWLCHHAMVKAFCYTKPPIQNFASQNGLRPPRFLRGAYFAVHWFDLNFIKIILANDFLDNIVFKFCINLNSRYFQNCVKTEQHSCEGQQFLVTLACPERRERERGKSDFAI